MILCSILIAIFVHVQLRCKCVTQISEHNHNETNGKNMGNNFLIYYINVTTIYKEWTQEHAGQLLPDQVGVLVLMLNK